jgi:TorA maturation chaperone TorD
MALKSSGGENNLLKAYNMMLYFAGTMIMWDPENECIRDFWKEGILKSLPVSSSNPLYIKAASQLRESISDRNSSFENMKNDFTALFSGAVLPLAPATESCYREKYNFVYGVKKSRVTDFYHAYGWQSTFRDTISDDHIGIELLFLTLMVEKYLELDDEVCNIEMGNETRRFIDDHLLTWVPDWNKSVQENAITLSYKGIGNLILACIEDIYAIMKGNPPPPLPGVEPETLSFWFHLSPLTSSGCYNTSQGQSPRLPCRNESCSF